MLNEDEVAALESLIRRMTDEQRSGLEVWITDGYLSVAKQWAPNCPLWPVVKKAQELHFGPWGTPQERRPHLTLVK